MRKHLHPHLLLSEDVGQRCRFSFSGIVIQSLVKVSQKVKSEVCYCLRKQELDIVSD